MKNNFILIALALLIFSACGNRQREDENLDYIASSLDYSSGKLQNGHNFWIDGYQEIDSTSDYLLFPLWLGVASKGKRSISPSRNNMAAQNSYWNLLFYNPLTREKHLLLEGKAVILSFSAFQSPKNPVANQLMFYQVIRNDFNGDGQLDYKDPVQLFVSDKNGNNFRPLTPPDRDLVGWQIYRQTPILIAELLEDANNDSLFNQKDPRDFLRIDLSNGQLGEPAFEPGFLDELEKEMKQNFPPADE
ncbi:MAG: hypothetical protein H6581_06840 [Bacteroidia bacterium]|nr:hypothetical protein [Bacteroidia bacterium]